MNSTNENDYEIIKVNDDTKNVISESVITHDIPQDKIENKDKILGILN